MKHNKQFLAAAAGYCVKFALTILFTSRQLVHGVQNEFVSFCIDDKKPLGTLLNRLDEISLSERKPFGKKSYIKELLISFCKLNLNSLWNTIFF